jgi:hypothetical protein
MTIGRPDPKERDGDFLRSVAEAVLQRIFPRWRGRPVALGGKMAAPISSGKGKRTADRPHRALSEADGHRGSAILPHLQHGGRSLPVGSPDESGSRGAQHRSIDPGRSWSIITRMRRNRSRGTATSAIWNTV